MGTRRYHGPVSTVDQAVFADMPILITCMECARFRQMHAYKLKKMKADAGAIRFLQARARASAYLTLI
jgi:hypothetical protein